jgi:hypothetical protein
MRLLTIAAMVLSVPVVLGQTLVFCPSYDSDPYIVPELFPPTLVQWGETDYTYTFQYYCCTTFPDENSACRAGCAIEYQ